MKYAFILISMFMILANLLVGFIYPPYLWWKFGASSCMIVVGTILLSVVQTMDLKEGFKVSLTCILPVFTFVEFVLAALSNSKIEGNWLLLIILLLVLIQIVILISCYIVSLNLNNDD